MENEVGCSYLSISLISVVIKWHCCLQQEDVLCGFTNGWHCWKFR